MEGHTFGTGKLLIAKETAADEAQWYQLMKEIRRLEGPYKEVEKWKKLKLWSDQKLQERRELEKAKGPIRGIHYFKNADFLILSRCADESIASYEKKIGFEERPKFITLPLGLVPKTSSNKRNFIDKEQDASNKRNFIDKEQDASNKRNFIDDEQDAIDTIEESFIQDNKETNLLSQPQASAPSQNNNERTSEADTIFPISVCPVDEPRNQHTVSKNTTVSCINTGQELITSNIHNPSICRNSKCLRSSAAEETVNSFKDVQERQSESLQTIAVHLGRITSATEEQNELFRQCLTLQERTLTTLCKTIDALKEK